MKTRKKHWRIAGRAEKNKAPERMLIFAIFLAATLFTFFPGWAAGAAGTKSPPTEQELAVEKLFSTLEVALAQKFFDYRNRPLIRIAIFDFTDEAGNAVKSGQELADKLTRRLYNRAQFDVVSREKIDRYLKWNGRTTLSRLDAEGLYRLQRRLNTMDPGNGISALITGEIRKGVGRSLRVSTSVINFQFKVGAIELEKNIIDVQLISGEIPLPTEQALQEAAEIVIKAENRPMEEGRLIILANTRGNAVVSTEYAGLLSKDRPFPWMKVPYILTMGKQEVNKPAEVKIGLGKLLLSPLLAKSPEKGLEYPLLKGKFATDAVYFDEILPAQKYRLVTSFLDLKTSEPYSEAWDIQVDSGITTVIVVSIYVPAEKERIRSKQVPRIDIFEFFGKGTEITPGG